MAKTRTMNELRQEKNYGYKAPEPKWDVEGHKEYNKEQRRGYSEIDIETTKDLIFNQLKNKLFYIMFQAFLGPISELAGSFMQGQIEKQKAKATLAQTKAAAEAEIMKTAATHDSKWEIIMAQGTQNSWKDELVTVVILIPTILVFIPGMEDIVKNGFERLNELPEWYTYLLFLTVSAALGIRGLDKWKNKK